MSSETPAAFKAFWLWLETLKKTEEPDAGGVPRVIHIEHPSSDKDFDIVGQGDANGEKVVLQGHVSRQADGKFKVAFSELGRPPAYSPWNESGRIFISAICLFDTLAPGG